MHINVSCGTPLCHHLDDGSVKQIQEVNQDCHQRQLDDLMEPEKPVEIIFIKITDDAQYKPGKEEFSCTVCLQKSLFRCFFTVFSNSAFTRSFELFTEVRRRPKL